MEITEEIIADVMFIMMIMVMSGDITRGIIKILIGQTVSFCFNPYQVLHVTKRPKQHKHSHQVAVMNGTFSQNITIPVNKHR